MDDMYTIGRLSKIVGISPDTLRYYDEIGLLKPTHISQETGYRYYSVSQATALNRIIEFKQFGFSLNEIKEMLADNNATLTEIYRKRYAALLIEKLRTDSILKKLSEKINQHEQEEIIMNNKILLVDDSAFMRQMCKDGFSKNGFEIIAEAENGEAGAEAYKKLKPDLVVLNILMPKMDGIQALRKIKEHDPAAAVVMLTASGQRTMVIEALRSGARRFVVKPFNMQFLLKAAREALENQTFNPEALKLLEPDSRNPYSGSLSQTSIDELILIAQSETDKAKIMLESFTETYVDENSEPNPNETDNANSTHALLSQIAQGQDDIKNLLQTLISKFDTND
jgi:two-component system chemotaxis response regulator CheY